MAQDSAMHKLLASVRLEQYSRVLDDQGFDDIDVLVDAVTGSEAAVRLLIESTGMKPGHVLKLRSAAEKYRAQPQGSSAAVSEQAQPATQPTTAAILQSVASASGAAKNDSSTGGTHKFNGSSTQPAFATAKLPDSVSHRSTEPHAGQMTDSSVGSHHGATQQQRSQPPRPYPVHSYTNLVSSLHQQQQASSGASANINGRLSFPPSGAMDAFGFSNFLTKGVSPPPGSAQPFEDLDRDIIHKIHSEILDSDDDAPNLDDATCRVDAQGWPVYSDDPVSDAYLSEPRMDLYYDLDRPSFYPSPGMSPAAAAVQPPYRYSSANQSSAPAGMTSAATSMMVSPPRYLHPYAGMVQPQQAQRAAGVTAAASSSGGGGGGAPEDNARLSYLAAAGLHMPPTLTALPLSSQAGPGYASRSVSVPNTATAATSSSQVIAMPIQSFLPQGSGAHAPPPSDGGTSDGIYPPSPAPRMSPVTSARGAPQEDSEGFVMAQARRVRGKPSRSPDAGSASGFASSTSTGSEHGKRNVRGTKEFKLAVQWFDWAIKWCEKEKVLPRLTAMKRRWCIHVHAHTHSRTHTHDDFENWVSTMEKSGICIPSGKGLERILWPADLITGQQRMFVGVDLDNPVQRFTDEQIQMVISFLHSGNANARQILGGSRGARSRHGFAVSLKDKGPAFLQKVPFGYVEELVEWMTRRELLLVKNGAVTLPTIGSSSFSPDSTAGSAAPSPMASPMATPLSFPPPDLSIASSATASVSVSVSAVTTTGPAAVATAAAAAAAGGDADAGVDASTNGNVASVAVDTPAFGASPSPSFSQGATGTTSAAAAGPAAEPDHAALLLEKAQLLGLSPVLFHWETMGAAHAPVWRCTLDIWNFTPDGTRPSSPGPQSEGHPTVSRWSSTFKPRKREAEGEVVCKVLPIFAQMMQSRRGSVGEADETRSTKTEISISKTDFMSIYSDDAGSVAASASSSAALVHVLKPDSIAILGCIGSMVLKRRAFVYHMEQIGSTGSVHSQGWFCTVKFQDVPMYSENSRGYDFPDESGNTSGTDDRPSGNAANSTSGSGCGGAAAASSKSMQVFSATGKKKYDAQCLVAKKVLLHLKSKGFPVELKDLNLPTVVTRSAKAGATGSAGGIAGNGSLKSGPVVPALPLSGLSMSMPVPVHMGMQLQHAPALQFPISFGHGFGLPNYTVNSVNMFGNTGTAHTAAAAAAAPHGTGTAGANSGLFAPAPSPSYPALSGPLHLPPRTRDPLLFKLGDSASRSAQNERAFKDSVASISIPIHARAPADRASTRHSASTAASSSSTTNESAAAAAARVLNQGAQNAPLDMVRASLDVSDPDSDGSDSPGLPVSARGSVRLDEVKAITAHSTASNTSAASAARATVAVSTSSSSSSGGFGVPMAVPDLSSTLADPLREPIRLPLPGQFMLGQRGGKLSSSPDDGRSAGYSDPLLSDAERDPISLPLPFSSSSSHSNLFGGAGGRFLLFPQRPSTSAVSGPAHLQDDMGLPPGMRGPVSLSNSSFGLRPSGFGVMPSRAMDLMSALTPQRDLQAARSVSTGAASAAQAQRVAAAAAAAAIVRPCSPPSAISVSAPSSAGAGITDSDTDAVPFSYGDTESEDHSD